MKILNKVFGVLAIVFGAAALVLFFTDFGKVALADGTEPFILTGTEFAFGSGEKRIETAISSDLLFCLILTAFTVLFSSLSIKFKKTRWAAIGFSIVVAIYMLVVATSTPSAFLDTRGFGSVVASSEYVNNAPLFIAIALFLNFGFSTSYLLVSDRIAAKESGSLTIPQKIVKFLRDYKGEIKKVVWPGRKAVIKNTLIVLMICAIFGAFIWLIDLGLGSLLDLIFG